MIVRHMHLGLAAVFVGGSLAACQPAPLPQAPAPTPAPAAAATPQPSPRVVEVTAVDYAFRAPEVIPSGWTTFRMRNEGEISHHFALLTRLPEGKTMDDYLLDVGTAANEAWYAVRSGEMNKGDALKMMRSRVPEWTGSLRRIGGPGLLAPGRVSEVTLYLEPGEYFMECYLKTPEGEIHAIEGMIRPFTVTNEPSGASPPQPDLGITLLDGGVAAPEEIAPGRHIIAVHFAEQPAAGGQHDLHLARLDEGMNAAEIVPWMDWIDADGFWNPAPATFLGGTHEMPAGSTVYVTVDLEPGRYAWISQMTAAQGMLKEFTVR